MKRDTELENGVYDEHVGKEGGEELSSDDERQSSQRRAGLHLGGDVLAEKADEPKEREARAASSRGTSKKSPGTISRALSLSSIK